MNRVFSITEKKICRHCTCRQSERVDVLVRRPVLSWEPFFGMNDVALRGQVSSLAWVCSSVARMTVSADLQRPHI